MAQPKDNPHGRQLQSKPMSRPIYNQQASWIKIPCTGWSIWIHAMCILEPPVALRALRIHKPQEWRSGSRIQRYLQPIADRAPWLQLQPHQARLARQIPGLLRIPMYRDHVPWSGATQISLSNRRDQRTKHNPQSWARTQSIYNPSREGLLFPPKDNLSRDSPLSILSGRLCRRRLGPCRPLCKHPPRPAPGRVPCLADSSYFLLGSILLLGREWGCSSPTHDRVSLFFSFLFVGFCFQLRMVFA
jgi:hypothetical protein